MEPADDLATLSIGRRVLGYIPNRLSDLADIFRVRVRFGPGVAAGIRLTDYGAFYAGSYRSVYVGLPGPRAHVNTWSCVGREDLTGFVLAGVDATDDTAVGPRYSATEMDIGLHLLIAGADVGIDPVELVDFLCGWFMIDLRQDDFFTLRPEVDEPESALSIGPGTGALRVAPKPDRFASWGERLDYLQTNVQKRIDNPIREADARFAVEKPVARSHQTRFRLGLYTEVVEDEGTEVSFEPDFDIEVDLPNVERRMKVFVETARADDLPGRGLTERENKGMTVGAGQWIEGYNLALDAGIRTRWPPELYGRIAWRPKWKAGPWSIRPEQRLFWESEDGFGELTQLGISRWMGESRAYAARSQSAAKLTEETDGLEWEQSIGFSRVLALIDEHRRGRNADFDDTSHAYGIGYSVFGEDGDVTEHRVTVGCRFPVYRRWLFADVRPGLQWKEENDYELGYRVEVGFDMLFWGAGYQ